MSERFAGSRSVDERRRRRLASDSKDADGPSDSSSEPTSPDSVTGSEMPDSFTSAPHREEGPRARGALRLPVRKLISPKPWKLWSLGGAALAVAAGILVAGLMVETEGPAVGPGFAHLFALTPGRAVTGYAGLLMLLSGQLAWLIWWVRSRSLQDFAGRYRVWTWVAVAGFGFAFLMASGAHRAWSETVHWLWPVKFWNKDLLCWLVPVGGVVVLLLRPLYREMRDCRSSLTLLCLAGAGWLTACILMFLHASAAGVVPMQMLGSGAVLFGSVCLFQSFLLHSRHVIYVTAEPPEIRPAWWSLQQLVSGFRRLSLRRRRKMDPPEQFEGRSDTEEARDQPPEIDDPPVSEPSVSVPSDSVPGDKAAEPRPSANRRQSAPQTGGRKRSEKKPPKSPAIQVDEPHPSAVKPPDPEMMKGLSKKQRRKLRKQWREQQRAAQKGGSS